MATTTCPHGRFEVVDTIRGLACVLLVVWHVIGSGSSVGLRVPDDSGWRFCVDLLIYFRMPAFAVLAGYLYALTPVAEISVFLLAKARRLLLPMLVVGTLFVVMQSLVPGSNLNLNGAAIDWTMLHIVPVNHFWFIEAIFLIFVVVAVLDRWLRRGPMFIAALVVAMVIYPTIAPPPFLGLNGAVYLLPYFLCGLGYARFRVEHSGVIAAAISLFILAYAYACAGLLGYVPHSERNSFVALIIGVTGPLLLIHSGWRHRALAYVAVNAYAIFLFHPFFSAAARILLHAMGIRSIAVLLVTGTVAGIVGPILIAMVADWFPITRTALLGKKWAGNSSGGRKFAHANRSGEPELPQGRLSAIGA